MINMYELLTSQLSTEITTVVVFAASLLLAVVMSNRYMKKRSVPLLFWSAGMWLFSLGVLMEIVFALGIYSQLLADSYLLVVALLVNVLALGSIQLVSSKRIKKSYYAFSIVSVFLLLYSLATTNQGNMIQNYVLAGVPAVSVIIASSLITFPAAAILLVVAYLGYRKRKDKRLLSIIAGVIIVSVAGTLYIAAYPAFLYLAEVAGIALLWYGFM